ncbi:MAG: hypothetical protein ACFFCO_04090 [Promethearchaeota archaeon]
MTSRRMLEENVNFQDPGRRLKAKRQELEEPHSPLDERSSPAEVPQGPVIGADHLAILFVCQQGWQTLFDILQGVNATRVPIGKTPLHEADVLSLLEELEEQGYLNKIELRGRPAWTTTPKGKDLET